MMILSQRNQAQFGKRKWTVEKRFNDFCSLDALIRRDITPKQVGRHSKMRKNMQVRELHVHNAMEVDIAPFVTCSILELLPSQGSYWARTRFRCLLHCRRTAAPNVYIAPAPPQCAVCTDSHAGCTALSTEMLEQAGILAPLPRKVIPEFAIDNTLRAQQLDLYCKTLSADLSAEEVSFTSLDSYVSSHASVRLFTRILKSPYIPPTITASWSNPYRCANLLNAAFIEPIRLY